MAQRFSLRNRDYFSDICAILTFALIVQVVYSNVQSSSNASLEPSPNSTSFKQSCSLCRNSSTLNSTEPSSSNGSYCICTVTNNNTLKNSTRNNSTSLKRKKAKNNKLYIVPLTLPFVGVLIGGLVKLKRMHSEGYFDKKGNAQEIDISSQISQRSSALSTMNPMMYDSNNTLVTVPVKVSSQKSPFLV